MFCLTFSDITWCDIDLHITPELTRHLLSGCSNTNLSIDCLISPVEEGGQSSVSSKIRDTSCFRILNRSIFRIDLLIRPEIVRSPFFWVQKGPKSPKNAQIQYLVNRWSYEVGLPLIRTARPTFLLVFHIIYTPRNDGNGLKL